MTADALGLNHFKICCTEAILYEENSVFECCVSFNIVSLMYVQPLSLLWSWWCHQLETFSALLAICAGNSPVPSEFPAQRPVTRNFDVFFDLRPNKLLSKQSWGWWFETPSLPLWPHPNVNKILYHIEPYDVEARISENQIKIMPPDDLAPYVTRPSAAIVLPIQENMHLASMRNDFIYPYHLNANIKDNVTTSLWTLKNLQV